MAKTIKTHGETVAQMLEDGAVSDIWYACEDPKHIEYVEGVKTAMKQGARLIRQYVRMIEDARKNGAALAE